MKQSSEYYKRVQWNRTAYPWLSELVFCCGLGCVWCPVQDQANQPIRQIPPHLIEMPNIRRYACVGRKSASVAPLACLSQHCVERCARGCPATTLTSSFSLFKFKISQLMFTCRRGKVAELPLSTSWWTSSCLERQGYWKPSRRTYDATCIA